MAVDLDDNKHGQVKYQFLNNPYINVNQPLVESKKLFTSTFSLNENTGELRLLRALDRDLIDGDYVNLTIMAIDNGSRLQTRKSSNFTLRIHVSDLNNNKPEFNMNKVNYTIYLQPSEAPSNVEKIPFTNTLFKQIGSLTVHDKDSVKANSKEFNKSITSTESSKFHFKDNNCRQALHFELNTNSEHFPFVFLVEQQQHLNNRIQSTNCLFTIWLDLNDIIGMNFISDRKSIEFEVRVTDNGNNQQQRESKVLIHIDLNEINTDLFQFKAAVNNSINSSDKIKIETDLPSAANSIAEFTSSSKDFQVTIALVNKITLINNNQPGLTNIDTALFQIITNDNHKNLQLNDQSTEPGIYLIDLNITANSMSSFEQIQLLLDSNSTIALTQLLESYNNGNQATLKSNKLTNDLDFIHLQGLLFGNNTEFSIKASIFNTQSTINQFILLTCIVLFIILSLFMCCICLLVKRKCFKARSLKKGLNTNKHLNVSDSSSKFDDDQSHGGFNQIRIDQSSQKSLSESDRKAIFINPSDKVNHYLDGLSSIGSNDALINARNISSPPTSLSSLEDSTKKTNDQNSSSSDKSISSLSCISDEGCYGSSDFSTESNHRFSKQIKKQQQQYFSPSTIQQTQQKHYIQNLSRFEKIYNKKAEVVETCHNQQQRSNLATPVNFNNNQNQVITAISGSYV